MSGEEHRVTAETGESGEALVHLLGVRAGEVGAAATIEEKGVARDQPAIHQKALAAGRMTGGMQ